MAKAKTKKQKGKAKPTREDRFEEGTGVLIEDYRSFIIALGFLFAALIVAGFIWLIRDGWFNEQANKIAGKLIAFTARAGFAVQDVLVEGRSQTEKKQILATLSIKKDEPIFAFDPHAALVRLEDLSWVKSGIVERRLPRTIFVKLNERQPLAIWQNQKKLNLIDQDGKILREIDSRETTNYPLVVGEDAHHHAATMLDMVKAETQVAARVKALIRVGGRRWDLQMDNGIVVKLPEENVPIALQRLSTIITRENILERKATGIDLRLPDRAIIPTEDIIDPAAAKNQKKK